MKFASRGAWFRIAALLVVLMLLAYGSLQYMTAMPGPARAADMEPAADMPAADMEPAAGADTDEDPALARRLRVHVDALAGEIGVRNDGVPGSLEKCVAYIDSKLRSVGSVRHLAFEHDGRRYVNLDVHPPGTGPGDEVVVVGAHYDTARGTPGANDNGSGVAALLELARDERFDRSGRRSLRFVAFANEEPPHFKKRHMGSLAYARRCRERGEKIVAMWSLETMGYYSDEPGSQKYPWPLAAFYPTTGNSVAFVGNLRSRDLVRRSIASFRRGSSFPSEGGAFPALLPGVGWSDHWSFWKAGYPAVMVTDTAPFRYPHYHTANDTPDKLDYVRLACVVRGLSRALDELRDEG